MSDLESSSGGEAGEWPPTTPQTPNASYYVEVASSVTTTGSESLESCEESIEKAQSQCGDSKIGSNKSKMPDPEISKSSRVSDESGDSDNEQSTRTEEEELNCQNAPPEAVAGKVSNIASQDADKINDTSTKQVEKKDGNDAILDEMMALGRELDLEKEQEVGLKFDYGDENDTNSSKETQKEAQKSADDSMNDEKAMYDESVSDTDKYGKDYELMLLKREMEVAALNQKREEEMLEEERKRRLEIRRREIEMERKQRLEKLEELAQVVEMMTVQYDSKIEQMKNVVDEINAELMVAESVELAREMRRGQTLNRERLLDGYKFSSSEADFIMRKMARRSEAAHSSYVSSMFSLSGSTDFEPDFFAKPTKSSYPAMIKRLVNAYAGRPNINGRSSTESHRLLRRKLKQVLDGNL